MIKVEKLVKVFEKNIKHNKKVSFPAVNGISLEVHEGEIVGILGPNGAGKTTLLRMLGHLMKPTEGTISVWNNDVLLQDELEIKKQLGYLSGNTKLYGRLSTRELLTIMGNIYELQIENIEEKINEISKVLEMDAFIDNRIEKLSTGQTQRASISRCLIHSPSTYIFDEPTLGLDILSSSRIIEFMKGEREKGKSVIYSTHYMEEAENLCDRIIMMNNGRIICQGTLDELKANTNTNNLREVFSLLIQREEGYES